MKQMTEKEHKLFNLWFRVNAYHIPSNSYDKRIQYYNFKDYKKAGGYHTLAYLQTHSPVGRITR